MMMVITASVLTLFLFALVTLLVAAHRIDVSMRERKKSRPF